MASLFASSCIPIQDHLSVFRVGLVTELAVGVFARVQLFLAHCGRTLWDALASAVLFHVEVIGGAARIAGFFAKPKVGVVAALRGSSVSNAASLGSPLHFALLSKQFFEAGNSARTKPGPHHLVELARPFAASSRKPFVLRLVVGLSNFARPGDFAPEDVHHPKDGFQVGHLDSEVNPVAVGVEDDRSLSLEQSGRVGDFFRGRSLRMFHNGDSTTPKFANARIGGVK